MDTNGDNQMSDNGHYYFIHQDGAVEAMHDLTLAQARDKGCYPSVTTKIGVLKDPGLEDWRLQKLILTAEQNRRYTDEQDADYVSRINDIVWGQPTRMDGVQFQSNVFGTLVHSEIEKWNIDNSYQPPPEWEPYVIGWQQWYSKEIAYTIKAEYMCVDHQTRTAGMIDFVGMTHSGNVVLCDYKNRTCDKGKGKFYFKDCMQLAIESRVIKSEMGLTYLPAIYSMCIDTITGRLFAKKWSETMQLRGIAHFEALSHAYNVINGFTGDNNGLE
jgi:hypothetical protein